MFKNNEYGKGPYFVRINFEELDILIRATNSDEFTLKAKTIKKIGEERILAESLLKEIIREANKNGKDEYRVQMTHDDKALLIIERDSLDFQRGFV
jgi:hypothetical protein